MLTHAFNPRAQEAEARGPEVQGQPRLCSIFQANVDYMRLYSKIILSQSVQGQESPLIQEVTTKFLGRSLYSMEGTWLAV